MYIKTSQVIPHPAAAISLVAYPPIDRILLQNLAKQDGPSFKYLSKLSWTTLDELTCFKLINDLRTLLNGRPFWVLEAYWEVG